GSLLLVPSTTYLPRPTLALRLPASPSTASSLTLSLTHLPTSSFFTLSLHDALPIYPHPLFSPIRPTRPRTCGAIRTVTSLGVAIAAASTDLHSILSCFVPTAAHSAARGRDALPALDGFVSNVVRACFLLVLECARTD